MKLILLGAPGAGKGTQAELLSKALSIPAISTGNMLREAMANGSELGKKVKYYMDEGLLVPDEVIIDLITQRVSRPDCANGYILDGVPRTLVQAETMEAAGIRVDHVISIEVADSVIESRMTGRRVCPKCGAPFHIVSNPPKMVDVCDHCGSGLVIRKDDAAETVRKRLQVFHATTEVLKDFYAGLGRLRLVNGDQAIELTNGEILVAIGAKA